MAQRDRRQYSTSAPGGYCHRQERSGAEDRGDGEQRQRIVSLDPEELTLEEARQSECQGNAQPEAQSNEPYTAAHDQPQDVSVPSAQRHAQADFPSAVDDRLRKHAEDADQTQHECKAGEYG